MPIFAWQQYGNDFPLLSSKFFKSPILPTALEFPEFSIQVPISVAFFTFSRSSQSIVTCCGIAETIKMFEGLKETLAVNIYLWITKKHE